MNNKTHVVHVNRLKIACNTYIWNPKKNPENSKTRTEKRITKSELQEYETQIDSRPLLKTRPPQESIEPRTPPILTPNTPDSVQQAADTPYFEGADPKYEPPTTPLARRELQATRPEPPLTWSRTTVQTQDHNVAETGAVLHARHRTPPSMLNTSSVCTQLFTRSRASLSR